MNNKGIGIFDSGLGGLTVVKEVMNFLPNEQILYLGDTARAPYGTKTKETIIKFTRENINFLLKKNVKIIVIACNTASALAQKEMKKEFDISIVGVIDAGAKAALAATRTGRIGVIGTRATIGSGAYIDAIKKQRKEAEIFSKATPLLVPLVEEGWLESGITASVLKFYLEDFKKKKIDTLVLGCTHYPLLKPLVRKILPGINIIDSAKEVAAEVRGLLENKGMLSYKNNSKKSAFFVTDTPGTFNKVGRMFLKKAMILAKKVAL